MKILTGLLCALSCSILCQGSEIETLIEKHLTTAREVENAAEALRATQPDFADWVASQAPIHENFALSLRYDAQFEPERVPSLLADWDYLLKRMAGEVEYFRNQPDLRRGTSLNVRDFGTKADGVHDDAPAIRRAIDQALAAGISRVFLPAGRYLVGDISDKEQIVFRLKNSRNLLIEGEKGTILVTASVHSTAFLIEEGCDNIQLSNMTITSAERPYTTGRIIERRNPNILVVAIDAGMPEATAPFFKQSNSGGLLRFYDQQLGGDGKTPVAASIASHSQNPGVKKLENGLYEFTLADINDVEHIYRDGMRLVMFARNWGNQKLINSFSDHTRWHRIRVESSSSMAFLNHGGEALFMTECSTGADDTTFVCMAADGIYFYNAQLGSYIARNDIRDPGDDFLNIHSPVRPAYAHSGKIIDFAPGWLPPWSKDLYRIGLVRSTKKEQYVSEEVSILKREELTRPDGVELIRLTCDRELPPFRTLEIEGAEGGGGVDLFVFNNAQLHGTVVRDNNFRYGVSRILPAGRNWVMSNNRIYDNLGWVVLFFVAQNINHMDETFYPRNISFIGNRVESIYKSVFQFSGSHAPGNFSGAMAHFRVENNQFIITPYGDNTLPLIQVKGVDDLRFVNNTIRAAVDGVPPASWGNILVESDNRGLVFADNSVDPAFKH